METTNQTALLKLEQKTDDSIFSVNVFEHAQRVAKMLSSSNLIPKEYQNNIQNTMIAMEMANRIGASPLMVMQNLNIIQGRPSWASSFIIGVINNCGNYNPLKFITSGEGDNYGCFAWTTEIKTGERIEGPVVTMKMATAEGWVNKVGSKWKTMPELMLRYRAAAFFGRLYVPELLMGMQTAEEVIDVVSNRYAAENVEDFNEADLKTELAINQAAGKGLITKERAKELKATLKGELAV